MDKEIKALIEKHFGDGYNGHNNIKLKELKLNYAKVEAKLTANSFNGNKIAHGGLIYSLADDAMGTAALSTGRNVCTVNAQIDYLRPGIGKKLIAEAESVKVGKTLGVYKCKIYNDEDKLVATATGTYYFLDA